MSTKKLLYFVEDNQIKSCDKIINLPIKSGENITNQSIKEFIEPLLLNKFIKMKIYPYNIVSNSNSNLIYFENKNVCKILEKNKKIYNYRTPKLIITNIYNLINKIDDELTEISKYALKVHNIEERKMICCI